MQAGMTVLSVFQSIDIDGDNESKEPFRSTMFVRSIFGTYNNFHGQQRGQEYVNIVGPGNIFYVPKDRALELILAIAAVNDWDIDVSGINVNEGRIAVVWDRDKPSEHTPELAEVMSSLPVAMQDSLLRIEQCTRCLYFVTVHRGVEVDGWKSHFDYCGDDAQRVD